MNAKTVLLICLCALSIKATCESADPPAAAEEIHLHGILHLNAGPNDVMAYVDSNTVYIYFNQNFGIVNVTLYNPLGATIYNGVVNTAVQQQVTIPITFTLEGTYTVVLENTFGYVDGDFNKSL